MSQWIWLRLPRSKLVKYYTWENLCLLLMWVNNSNVPKKKKKIICCNFVICEGTSHFKIHLPQKEKSWNSAVTKCYLWKTPPPHTPTLTVFNTEGKLMPIELEVVVAFWVEGPIQFRIYHVVEAGLDSWAPIPNWGAKASGMVWLLVGRLIMFQWIALLSSLTKWTKWNANEQSNYVVQSFPPLNTMLRS